MLTKPPHWQNYWYDLRFRDELTPAFEPMGHEGLRQMPNKGLASASLEELVERFVEECVDELDSLHGELQMLVYTDASPAPGTKPVLVRTIPLGRR
jgi:hypothetical protein